MAAGASPSVDSPQRVLVTGSTGFIGRRLVHRLERGGAVVTKVSRSNGIDFTQNDLPMDGVEHVYHLGGLSFVPDAWKDPAACYLANAYGTLRVLEECHRAGASMTFVSTYVYGSPAPIPVSEATPANPNNPYAFSKLAAEEACRFFAKTFGVKVSILRLFNAYGPGQAKTFLIPTIAQQVVDSSEAIVVADLAPRRDFIHVDDVVEALLISPHLLPGQPYNVGSGQSRSVQEVIEACLAAANVKKPYRAREERRTNDQATTQ